MSGPSAQDCDIDQIGIVTRYFLRRLALARRDKRDETVSESFKTAINDVAHTFFYMPLIGITSCSLMASLKFWSPYFVGHEDDMSVVGVVFLASVLYLWILNRRLRKHFLEYEKNPSACYAYDSERDRRIAIIQMRAVDFIAIMVAPVIGFMVGIGLGVL